MKQPKDWYTITARCDLHEHGQSNMGAPSRQEYCMRKDRNGKQRPNYEPLHCNWNVCPKLKDRRRTEKERESKIKKITPKWCKTKICPKDVIKYCKKRRGFCKHDPWKGLI